MPRKEKRNPVPSKKPRRNPGGLLTPMERRELASARRMSTTIHGRPEVVELSAKERRLPRFLAIMGKATEVSYLPDKGSKKGDGKVEYVHKSGDRGFLRQGSKRKPLLAINPNDRRPVFVANGSPMKLRHGQLEG